MTLYSKAEITTVPIKIAANEPGPVFGTDWAVDVEVDVEDAVDDAVLVASDEVVVDVLSLVAGAGSG
jgi:hypothetical protein